MSNLRAKGVIRAILEPGNHGAQHGFDAQNLQFHMVLSEVQSLESGGGRYARTTVSRSPHSPTDVFTVGCTRRPVDDLCREAPHRADLAAATRRRSVHTAPVASQGNGRHGTRAGRSLAARFTRSSTECRNRGRTHCRALHSVGDAAPVALDDGHSKYVSGVPLVGAICSAVRNSRFALLAEAAGGAVGAPGLF